MNRPEYVTCIRHTRVDRVGKTWCGRPAVGFVFQNIDHAANNGLNDGSLVACPECAAKVALALAVGVPS